ncbi:MAG: tyrosine-type recombinase/integrase [Thermoleophilia bacterium]|nr:tyrosine-type recombinase/integrase [Thermoleophilia bacterium]
MSDWSTSLDDLEARLARQGSRGAVLSERTRRAYLKDARMLAAWLEAHGVPEPGRVTPSALSAALRGLGWSASTRARALTAAREWLSPLFPPGRSPAERVERPRVTPPLVPRLSQDDARELVEAVATRADADGPRRALGLRDRAMVELLYGSGLRRQEVCDLVLAGLDFEHETVRLVGKGGKARTVPLTEPAVAALRDWLAEGRPRLLDPESRVLDQVFVSRTGKPLDGSAVYRAVAPVLREMGRAGGPHLLRHAAATHLLEGPPGGEGAHLRVVQEVLGHASLATTQRYTGVTTRDIQRQLRRGHPRG